MIAIAGKQSNNSTLNNTSINNSSIINQTSINTPNILTNTNIPDLDLTEFIDLALKGVSFCLCPSLDQENINLAHPKPVSMSISRKSYKEEHNLPENTELPKTSNKDYCLVLDMDETLIHFFDVRN